MRRIRRMLRESSPDLLRCYNHETLFHAVPASLGLGVPIVYYNGGRLGETPRRLRIERALSTRVSRVVVPSGELRDYMVRTVGIAARKVRVIENGVDTARFRAPLDVVEVRRELGLAPSARVLGTVGRLSAEKDHRTLLRAFDRVRREEPDARLLVVGDGPLRGELSDFARELGLGDAALFLGPRNDAPRLYRVMDVFLLTSRTEGFSNVLLEAAAAGVPLVSTRVQGASRLVEDGVTGFLAAPEDDAALAERALAVLRDASLARRLREAASKRVDETFSLARMAREYEELYRELIGSRRRAEVDLGPHRVG
jgi:glycosyltransferase involved in cell wall biosynthesis